MRISKEICHAYKDKGKYICWVNEFEGWKTEVASQCPAKDNLNQCSTAMSDKLIVHMKLKRRPNEAECSSDPDDCWPRSRSGDVGGDFFKN